MKCLVTGGYGFIGSNLVKELANKCFTIDIVDDMSNGHKELLSWEELNIRPVFPELMSFDTRNDKNLINFYECDFAYDGILKRIASGYYDVIFHLAAIPRVSFSVENPAETTEANLMSTIKLFDAARYGKTKVVFSSSSSVYGGADNLPTKESEPKRPKSPYAWQKSACEDAAKLYCELYDDSNIVCLRYFNVFGPNQYGDSPYSTAISAWCHAIKNDLECRSDGDGTQSRDMCYVDNVVQANILAAKSTLNFGGKCYNVACGDRVSNNEILNYLKNRFGEKVKVRIAPERAGDVKHTQADISKIKKDLGYTVQKRFWEGLEETIKWWGIRYD